MWLLHASRLFHVILRDWFSLECRSWEMVWLSSEASSQGLAHSSRTNIWERWRLMSQVNSVFGEDSNDIWLGPGEFRHRAYDVFSGSREKHTGDGNQGLTQVKHSFCHWVVLPAPPMNFNMCSKFFLKKYMFGWKWMSKVKLTSAFSHQLATFWPDYHGNNNGHEHEHYSDIRFQNQVLSTIPIYQASVSSNSYYTVG